jgi:hypothetical protein
VPSPPADDRPATLWTLRKDARTLTCRARLEAHGVEVDLAYDGALVATRTFETGEEALAWAGGKRADREAQGWSPAPPDPSAEPTGRVQDG